MSAVADGSKGMCVCVCASRPQCGFVRWINANALECERRGKQCYRSEAINTDFSIWFSVCSRIFVWFVHGIRINRIHWELEQTADKWQPADGRRANWWKAITVHSHSSLAQQCGAFLLSIVDRDKKSGYDRSRHVCGERYQRQIDGPGWETSTGRKRIECIKLYNRES